MKYAKKLLPLAAVLTLVVAVSGCVTPVSFSIDMWLDPQYEFNHVKVVSYSGSGDGKIIRAVHVEKEIATGNTYTYNMLTDPSHYTWVTTTVPSGTTDKIVCYWAAHHIGSGWEHTVTLTIEDTAGSTATATVTKSI